MVAVSHRDHARRQVDPPDETSAPGEVTAHPARAAPGVEDLRIGTAGHRRREGVDHREVETGLGPGVREMLGVILRDGVVGDSHTAEAEQI